MDWPGLAQDLQILTFRGQYALEKNRLAEAEEIFEQAIELASFAATEGPSVDTFYALATSLFNLATVLERLGANPETVPLLESSAHLYRQAVDAGLRDAEVPLALVLMQLAQAYRGLAVYIDFGRPPMTRLEEMREYRLELMARGEWRGPRAGLVVPDVQAKSEAPLTEVIPILRRLVRGDRDSFESILALALNLLGETYLDTGREREAEAPLRESEAMYRRLVLINPDKFESLLTDTLSLLGRLPPGGD